jgi:hypothetical protein
MLTHLKDMPKITLAGHKTLFWRYQRGQPETALATVEAVYYFYVDLYNEKLRRGLVTEEYSGQYDNLLWFFLYNYKNI